MESDVVTDLERLVALKERGAIEEAEFKSLKDDLLSSASAIVLEPKPTESSPKQAARPHTNDDSDELPVAGMVACLLLAASVMLFGGTWIAGGFALFAGERVIRGWRTGRYHWVAIGVLGLLVIYGLLLLSAAISVT